MNMLATSSVTCWHKACVWTYSGGGLVVKSCPTLATPWTVAHQAPLSMGFPRQEYWSGLPCPSPGDLSKSGVEPVSPALAGGFFTSEPPGRPWTWRLLTNTNTPPGSKPFSPLTWIMTLAPLVFQPQPCLPFMCTQPSRQSEPVRPRVWSHHSKRFRSIPSYPG